MPRRAPRKHNARTPLSRLSVAELHKEIRRRQRAGERLLRRVEKVRRTLAELERQAAENGVDSRRLTARRNDTNLVDSLRAVLKRKTMSVMEAVEAVRKAGYRSSAANFRTMVNIALLKKEFFKRVERGRYTAV
ncbi:hypothetical protein PHYC_03261 [Phycisphaerales bacterium]|nr:hypothetical protein PHYC_03261 [Phycisphaerales bacterium]